MLCKILCFFFLLTSSLVSAERLAFIYYYAWYDNPAYGREWMHWQENEHDPPLDIASSFYPKLGPYSSVDPAVIDQHMRWIAGANLNVLIYSWWGKSDFTNKAAKLVLDAAADYNLKVAFLIEPYPGRNPKTICDNIEYLNRNYGDHPAFFRLSRKTAFSPDRSPKGVFFIYDPDYSDDQLKQLSDTIHASSDSIVLLHSTDATLIQRTHADGIFAYEAVQNVMHFYKGIVETVKTMNAIFIPCVAPGFNINRMLGEKSPIFRARRNGETYDDWWQKTIAADPDFVAVISFNEWHEGTQIEPAIEMRAPKKNYLSYKNAYKKSGNAAQQSYLRRTARWIELFQQLP